MALRIPRNLEANPARAVRAVGREAVEVYCFLQQRYAEMDPREDTVFQFVFRTGYRLDSAGLTDNFKTGYFQLFSDARASAAPDLELIVRRLYRYKNLKGQHTLQFSFATKLAATADVHRAIYDAEIARIFEFRPPYINLGFRRRLQKYMTFFNELTALYHSIIDQDRMQLARRMFRETYGVSASEVSEVKALDFIFWSAGRQLRKRPT